MLAKLVLDAIHGKYTRDNAEQTDYLLSLFQ